MATKSLAKVASGACGELTLTFFSCFLFDFF